jgi:hypothetical protein
MAAPEGHVGWVGGGGGGGALDAIATKLQDTYVAKDFGRSTKIRCWDERRAVRYSHDCTERTSCGRPYGLSYQDCKVLFIREKYHS